MKKQYEAPSVGQLGSVADKTEGGDVPTCDQQCSVADNTFPASPEAS